MDVSYTPQSGEVGLADSQVSSLTVQQNVEMAVGDAPEMVGVYNTPDPTMECGDEDELGLSEFFARPVQIQQFDWSTSVRLFESFKPWENFFITNTRVANRISNYNRLHAKLHVKFIITGNGFYYGRLLASYLPLSVADAYTRDRFAILQDNVEASQRPYVTLDPSTSRGAEMELPFVYQYDSATLPTGDIGNMGSITLRELNRLRHANDPAPPTITVTVLAWATEVKLSVPTKVNTSFLQPQAGVKTIPLEETSVDPEIRKKRRKKKKKEKDDVPLQEKVQKRPPRPKKMRPQAGEKKKKKPVADKQATSTADEYGSGPISKPASLVADIAGKLVSVPWIGPYARATQVASGAVGKIAALFGYSRPANLETIHPYVPRFAGNIANVDAEDDCFRLTTDSKQEVTIDTRVMGLAGCDELAVTNVVTRQSYLTKCDWQDHAETGTLGKRLIAIAVHPMMYDTYGTDPTEYHLTALAFGSMPFTWWRGTLRYRFQVVASQYHRGKLKIVYDPRVVDTEPEYNTQYTYIVDISEERDFTIDVGWGQARGWLPIEPPNASTITYSTNASAVFTPRPYQNGMLAVYVMNELSTPGPDTAPAEINVYVSAADDIEYAAPDSTNLQLFSPYAPQSGYVPQSGEVGGETAVDAVSRESNDPTLLQEKTAATMATAPPMSSQSLMVYQGECITSYRQLLKRYDYWKFFPNTSAEKTLDNLILPCMPPAPGYDPNGREIVDVDVPFDTGRFTILSYLSLAYVGWRGSIRWKLVDENISSSFGSSWLSATKMNKPSKFQHTADPLPDLSTDSDSVISWFFRNQFINTYAGTAMTPASRNNVLTVEVPYQADARFYHTRKTSNNKNYNNSDTSWLNVKRIVDATNQETTDFPAGLHTMVSVGEDFNLGLYLGPPVLFETGAPVPV